MTLPCECISAGIALVGFAGTAYSILLNTKENKSRLRFQKGEYFLNLRQSFKGNATFTAIREAVQNREDLTRFSRVNIYDYAGFFEDIKIAIDSGFVSPKMAAYLFGHYIIEFDSTLDVRPVINRDADLWTKYKAMVDQMRREIDNKDFNNLEF
jgi:hypothetical protein